MTQSLDFGEGVVRTTVINSAGPKNLFWLTPFGLMVHLVLHNSIALVMCHHQKWSRIWQPALKLSMSLCQDPHTHLTKVVKNLLGLYTS